MKKILLLTFILILTSCDLNSSKKTQNPILSFCNPDLNNKFENKDFYLFDASETGKNHELWITDGTTKGTKAFLKNHALNKTPGADWISSNGNEKIFIVRHIDKDHDHHGEHHNRHSTEEGEMEVFVTAGTCKSTYEVKGDADNAFKKVAAKFFVIDKSFYFLGFSKQNKYSIYKIENKKAINISKNILKTLNLTGKNYQIKAINNKIYLFTMMINENSIFNFDLDAKQWKKLGDTQNFAVYPPLQIVNLAENAYILTKAYGLGAKGSRLYKLNTETNQLEILDKKLIPVGISKCFNNSVCGFSLTSTNSKPAGFLRIFSPTEQKKVLPLKVGNSNFYLNQLKSVHLIKDSLYILQEESKAPVGIGEKTRTIYKIQQDASLKKVSTEVNIFDIAKRKQDNSPIQTHINLKELGFLFISDAKKPNKEFACFEPWSLNTKNLQAQQIIEIFPKKNSSKIATDACYSSFSQATRPILLNNKIIFAANSGDKGEDAKGRELYTMDSTGIKLLKDIAKGNLNGIYEDEPHSHSGHKH